MDFVNLFIINKLSSKNGSENSVCKWYVVFAVWRWGKPHPTTWFIYVGHTALLRFAGVFADEVLF